MPSEAGAATVSTDPHRWRRPDILALAGREADIVAIVRNNAYRGIGTLEQIRAHILRVRDTIGITYFCLSGPDVERLGPIVQELSGN